MYRLQTIYKIILWQEEEQEQYLDVVDQPHHELGKCNQNHPEGAQWPEEDLDNQLHHVHHEGHKGHQGLEEIVDGHKHLKDLHHHEGHKGHDLGLLADLQLILLDKG